MLHHVLLVSHIVVLGYWLGADLVINSTFRHVCRACDMPFAERDRLLDHIMNADQHVRYALALQIGLGLALGSQIGLIPGGDVTLWSALLFTIALLVLIEVAHRTRKRAAGKRIAQLERVLRYALAAVFALSGLLALFGQLILPAWFAGKLVLFAGVIACGVLIRLILIEFSGAWTRIGESGSTSDLEQKIDELYLRSTRVLAALWSCISAITFLSVVKPV